MKVYVSPKAFSPEDLKDDEMKTIRGGNSASAMAGGVYPTAVLCLVIGAMTGSGGMTTV